MRRVVVTGASGFLGRRLVMALRQRGLDVLTLGRKRSHDGHHLTVSERSWTAANLAIILGALEPEAVFHFAGATSGSPAELEKANVGLTTELLQGLRQANLRPHLVLSGSAAEYGNSVVDGVPVDETTVCSPVTPYGKSKLEQTRAVLAYGEATGAPALIARIFNPIGPGMPSHLALRAFASQIAAMEGTGGVLTTGDIDVKRDFLDANHVANAICNLAVKHSATGIVNICSGQAISLRELLDMMIALSGKAIDVVVDPSRLRPFEPKIIVGCAKLLEKFGELPPATGYAALIDQILKSEAKPEQYLHKAGHKVPLEDQGLRASV
jgi:GDP-4-dehydro-6-deoxy-D-mannose reductase